MPLYCECGKEMMQRNGSYGLFFGCSAYPNCTHTKSYSEKNRALFNEGSDASFVPIEKYKVCKSCSLIYSEIHCPDCGNITHCADCGEEVREDESGICKVCGEPVCENCQQPFKGPPHPPVDYCVHASCYESEQGWA